MLWDGNRQIQEFKDGLTFTTIYEQNSFEPVARVVSSDDEFKVFHYHNDHLGTLSELTNEECEVVWLNYSKAWGESYEVVYDADKLGIAVTDDVNISA